VYPEQATCRMEAPSDASEAPKRQVYIRAKSGKALRTDVSDINEFFASCGKPVAILNKHGEQPDAGQLYETALVSFKKDKAVEKACGLSGQQLSGREVIVGVNTRPPRPKGAATSSVRVFCGNLPFDATDADLRAHFGGCGKILFVRFACDPTTGTNRGFCHVIFEDPPETRGQAMREALALNGSKFREREISVGAAPPQQKAKKLPKKAKATDGEDGDAEKAKKRLRPEEWRFDREAGLTLPRPKQKWKEWS